MGTGLLTIGRFAQLARLSVKQLRRYDELGLLAPARVDPETGYRFYHPRQARTAVTIALLRELDVPLATIRDLLVAGGDEAAGLLAGERERREAELDRARRAVAALGALTADGGLPDVAAAVRALPPRRLAVVHARADAESLARTTERLAGALAAVAPDPDAPFVGLFPLDVPGAAEVVLGVDGDVAGLERCDLPGGPAAVATHTGPVETVALSWFPLLAWVHERGLEPLGTVREEYAGERCTRLSIPLKEA